METTYAKIKRLKASKHRPISEQRLYRIECKRASEFRRWPHFVPCAYATREEAKRAADQQGLILVQTWDEAEAMEEAR